MVTIKDIAQQANVSIATVSMVLNDKGAVSDETRKRVLGIARQLNYMPSFSAQALKTKRSHTLGLVVGDLSNSYFSDIITAAEETARKKGYGMLICDAKVSIENAIRCFRELNARSVDGIIFSLSIAPTPEFEQAIAELRLSGLPMLSLTRIMEHSDLPMVTFSDEELVKGLINELIDGGHRCIGAIAAQPGSWLNEHRLKSYITAMKDAGLHNEDYIVYSTLTMDAGKEAATQLLDRFPQMTAIYGINDMVTLGAMRVAYEKNLRVPQQLSLLGSDGIAYTRVVNPTLATIVTPRAEMGRIAVNNLLSLVENGGNSIDNKVIIPCTVQRGDSMSACV